MIRLIRGVARFVTRLFQVAGTIGLLLFLYIATPLLMAQVPATHPTTNNSVQITSNLTYQTLLPTSFSRLSVTIENNNQNSTLTSTELCYLIIGTGQITPGTTTTTSNITIAGNSIPAGKASIQLPPGGSYQRYWPFTISDTMYVACTTGTSDYVYVDTQ